MSQMEAIAGLSPRLRGNRSISPIFGYSERSIPAPAGEPAQKPFHHRPAQVYPRACGGTASVGLGALASGGLSPRLRGNRIGGPRRAGIWGSIPAPAGEPGGITEGRRTVGVYPRACGGTSGSALQFQAVSGQSPRLRGNPAGLQDQAQRRRSIPAPAGEPYWRTKPIDNCPVYPRACGGTEFWIRTTAMHVGLSPRLRGNLHAERH